MVTASIEDRLCGWKDCERCGLHRFRRSVVIGRGWAPADILAIGEAPGKSEDLRGRAFIGPAGRILDKAIESALNLLSEQIELSPSIYFTNVVACRPTDYKHGPNREPTKDEMWACWPRLEETALIVKPRKIVLLGAVAKRYCSEFFPGTSKLFHPSFILRSGGQSSKSWPRYVRDWANIIMEVSCNET